jgi:hypothetical protein
MKVSKSKIYRLLEHEEGIVEDDFSGGEKQLKRMKDVVRTKKRDHARRQYKRLQRALKRGELEFEG